MSSGGTSDGRKVVVVGGGFGGVNAALRLARRARKMVDITLVTDESWFDYKPCIYRVVTGMPPFCVYVPLERIFRGTGVKITVDPMRRISLREGYVECASGERHHYDYLVIAIGSEVDFHGVPVLKPITFSANSLREAIRLSAHVDEVLSKIKHIGDSEGIALGHFVIVGGGPSGVEMAAAISNYTRRRASFYGVDPSMIAVDLIDSGPRLLKRLSPAISAHAHRRLRDLDVNIYYNRRVMEEHVEEVYFRDMHFKTATIVWTAGVAANRFLLSVEGAEMDKEGRLLVDDHLRLRGWPNVFAIGDSVRTPTTVSHRPPLHTGGTSRQRSTASLGRGRAADTYRGRTPTLSQWVQDGQPSKSGDSSSTATQGG